MLDAKIVVTSIINTANAQGLIASTAAAEITTGIVSVFLSFVFSGSSVGEDSPIIWVILFPCSFSKGFMHPCSSHLLISCFICSPIEDENPTITFLSIKIVGTPCISVPYTFVNSSKTSLFSLLK